MSEFNHTVFRTPDGQLYAVSKRVMDSGYKPQEGVKLAKAKEGRAFLKGLRERATTPEDKAAFVAALKGEGLFNPMAATLLGVPYPEEGEANADL